MHFSRYAERAGSSSALGRALALAGAREIVGLVALGESQSIAVLLAPGIFSFFSITGEGSSVRDSSGVDCRPAPARQVPTAPKELLARRVAQEWKLRTRRMEKIPASRRLWRINEIPNYVAHPTIRSSSIDFREDEQQIRKLVVNDRGESRSIALGSNQDRLPINSEPIQYCGLEIQKIKNRLTFEAECK
jgi:hypothetical protein